MTQRVRIRRTEERIAKHRRRTDEAPPEVVDDTREPRAKRVMEDYPNMDINPITEIMLRMPIEGNLTLLIHRFSDDAWRCLVGENVPRITSKSSFAGRLPRDFEKDVILSPEFSKWTKEWNKKSFEEKKAFAEENKIEWDSDHPVVQTQKMNLGYAVRSWLKIEKYRPAYRGPDGSLARKQARELAKVSPGK